ncbi:oxidoreductase [Pseudomonas chlororaphis]|uniref:oxidoreductase n=1 Tax=Pseudomonas chlororaphis TaxID=587753 RepID=UPI0015E03FED|nr:oxidoreductase [Pseudomonas chlororaphis]QLL11718.1 oxidoreductase [Pseudomonas chlororaphis subsp. aurantiaca]
MSDRKVTDDQIIEALKIHTMPKAAEHLGIHIRTLRKRKSALARKGWSPEHDLTHAVPDGFHLKGASTLYKDGVQVMQWVKSSIDHERQRELMIAACQAMSEDLPQIDPVSGPISTLASLMAVYPIGDAHIGMRAWGEETQGDSWDMTEAVRVQCGAMAALVDLAPPAELAVIINLGDWFHADNMEGMTSRSGHIMDLDGRYAKMISVGMKVMRQCIASALKKHAKVRVINVVGNHDDTGALWMSVALSHTYENEPRVQIDRAPSAFHYIEHGRVLIGTHHGHTCKSERLPGVMAADQAEAWGRTKYRYWYLGHVHHQSVKEYAGVTVESFNTLTAKDAYAAFGGYRAQQNMKCIVMHSEFGEVARHTVSPDMLKEVAA